MDWLAANPELSLSQLWYACPNGNWMLSVMREREIDQPLGFRIEFWSVAMDKLIRALDAVCIKHQLRWVLVYDERSLSRACVEYGYALHTRLPWMFRYCLTCSIYK